MLQRTDQVLARSIMTARMLNEQGASAAPELIDAQLLRWSCDEICLSGFERDELTRRDTAQAWHISSGHPLDLYSCQPVRDGGRPKPRWIQSQGQWYAGRLSVAEEYDDPLQRWLPVARFRAVRQDIELLPPLLNAKLIHLRDQRVVLSGVDRHFDSGAEVAQTWLLIQAGQQASGSALTTGGQD